MNSHRLSACLLLSAVFVGLSPMAYAQTAASSTIAGTVRDNSGAVLPGVTVEAASPALIEKVRTAVTDGQGNYKIIELRPGQYSVTFTLPGFSTLKRDGLELTTGFTATVNAEMNVGGVNETITVSGATPLVDVQNVRQQQVFKKEVQEAVPLGSYFAQYAAVLPGAVLSSATSQDVGGSGAASTYVNMHGFTGATEQGMLMNGMSFRSSEFGTTLRSPNPAAVDEVVLQTSGNPAEFATGGVQLNVIPRDGGNTFRATVVGNYGNASLQGDNVTPALQARGYRGVGDIKRRDSFYAGGGGPLQRDRLWFYTAYGASNDASYTPGNYFNASQGTLLYTPDLTRQAFNDNWERDRQVRLTFQATEKNKAILHYFNSKHCLCYAGLTGSIAPEAAARIIFSPQHLIQSTWTYPLRSGLLFDAGASIVLYSSDKVFQPGVSKDDIAVLDLARNYRYNAVATSLSSTGGYARDRSNQAVQRAGVTFITGSHALKFGMNLIEGWRADATEINHDVSYEFRGTRPQTVVYWATPSLIQDRSRELGLYAQDQWTYHRWTLNLGVRFDKFRGYVPEQHLPAGTYVPERNFAAVDNVPNWKNLVPRIGAAYDLFGNGKTALKGSFGDYANYENAGTAVSPYNPINLMVGSATRTWNDDGNHDYVPQEFELGPLSNGNFGRTVAGTRRADDVRLGWNTRPHNRQYSVQVQHELRPRFGINVGYFRTAFLNFTATDNLEVAPADYDPYCISAPQDSRLPGGGGYQVCGLYDLNRAKFGRVSNLVTRVSNFGKQTQVFNGIEGTMNLTFGSGGVVSGGFSTGATATDNCAAIVDSPQKQFCKNTPAWSTGNQIKFMVVAPLPWSLRLSATYQNLQGAPITASYVATNAEIRPSLGRNLGSCNLTDTTCNGTALLELIEPNTVFEDRLQQLDLRFTRLFRIGRVRLQGNVDIYNLFNANDVLTLNTRLGPSWLQPTSVLGARLVKIGFRLDM